MIVVIWSEEVEAAIKASAEAIAGLPEVGAAVAYREEVLRVPASPTGSLTVSVLGSPDMVPADHPAAIARAVLRDAGIDTGLYAIRAGADGTEYLQLTIDVSRDEGAKTVAITAAGVVEWGEAGGWRWREYGGRWVRLDGEAS